MIDGKPGSAESLLSLSYVMDTAKPAVYKLGPVDFLLSLSYVMDTARSYQ